MWRAIRTLRALQIRPGILIFEAARAADQRRQRPLRDAGIDRFEHAADSARVDRLRLRLLGPTAAEHSREKTPHQSCPDSRIASFYRFILTCCCTATMIDETTSTPFEFRGPPAASFPVRAEENPAAADERRW